MNGHYQKAENGITASIRQYQQSGLSGNSRDRCEAYMDGAMWELSRALVHAVLAAAPAPPPWLACVDQVHGTGTYELNPRHVVYIERRKDGWRHAVDVTGRAHIIVSDDDGAVQQDGGRP